MVLLVSCKPIPLARTALSKNLQKSSFIVVLVLGDLVVHIRPRSKRVVTCALSHCSLDLLIHHFFNSFPISELLPFLPCPFHKAHVFAPAVGFSPRHQLKQHYSKAIHIDLLAHFCCTCILCQLQKKCLAISKKYVSLNYEKMERFMHGLGLDFYQEQCIHKSLQLLTWCPPLLASPTSWPIRNPRFSR